MNDTLVMKITTDEAEFNAGFMLIPFNKFTMLRLGDRVVRTRHYKKITEDVFSIEWRWPDVELVEWDEELEEIKNLKEDLL